MKMFNQNQWIIGVTILIILITTGLGVILYLNEKKKQTKQQLPQPANQNTSLNSQQPSVEKFDTEPAPYQTSQDDSTVSQFNQLTAQDLLPNTQSTDSSWQDDLNPQVIDSNLLFPGADVNINSQGGTMKNPNLQLRSDPPIPKVDVGPWNNSDFQQDTTRAPLE